jgi:hypothetical protein
MAADQVQKRADWAIGAARAKFDKRVKEDIRGNNIPPITDAMIPQFCDMLKAVLEQTTPANIQVST